ncbi:MAG: ABC transporter ATP-binding protein [Clostridia bacterium]|nr:ABC transporter ATP-binding protein [Clostridia bacterium]
MKTVFSYCKPYAFYTFITLVIKTVGTVMDLFIPYLLGYILDEVVPHCTKDNLRGVFLWGSLMILCAVIALVGNVVANRRTSRFARDVIKNIRSDLFRKILSLSASQTDKLTVPSLVSRMSSDAYAVHSMLNVVLRAGLRAPILLIGGIVVTLSIEPVLSLSFVVLLPLLAWVVTFVSRKGVRLFKDKQNRVDAMVEKLRDTFTGIRVIKALSKIPYEREAFGTINQTLSHSEETANITMSVTRPVINVFLNLGMTAVVALGAWRVHRGFTTPGQIISFMSYFSIILNATLILTRIFTICTKGAASAERISEVFALGEDLPVLTEEAPAEKAPYLEFRDVTFSYNKNVPALEHLSFTLEKGQTLGIIGGTGAGKTTLIQLLLRFYDPDEGTILLEGRDLRTIPRAELKAKFGVVFQNDFLMADTLKENILFGRALSDEALERATVSAQADSFILEKSGLEYDLATAGANLSGGQRQRILISRALAGNPEILILDDASSALDYKTDAALRRAIREEHGDATCILVAQRISSIRHADLILVLEHGEVVGKGTDTELMENCPVYGEIAHSQMGEVMA